jgi:uncharacterized protein YjbI with pentapeptide repeats
MYSHRIILFIIILVCYFNCPAFANNSSENLKPAEIYVLRQVKKGEVADFRLKTKEDRILSADFLKKFLTGALSRVEETEKGIKILGARIKEKLDIREEKISFPITLECIFDKDIDFSGTKFAGRASFRKAKFAGGADFSGAKFAESANFYQANFAGKAYFTEAKFAGKAYFTEAKFAGRAEFFGAEFAESASFVLAEFAGRAYFSGAEFAESASFLVAKFAGRAYFTEAEFAGGVYFSFAEFAGSANFFRTKFAGKASFSNAYLSGADLSGTDLSEADLHEANLKDCLLWNVRGFPLNYEPKAGSPPYIPSIANLPNLSKLTFKKSVHGLVDLREGFKKFGYREQERKITYAIKYTQRRQLWNYSKKKVKDTETTESEKDSQKSISNKFEGLFYLLFFELTCQYGMKPGRPLIILMGLIPFFSFFYIFALKTKRQKTGLWLIFLKERVLKATKEERPFKLTAKFPPRVTPTGKLNKIKLRLLRSYRTIRIALYFSLLSATTIGWREFNVGNWISRLQRREYTLRATGWVRTVQAYSL